MDKNEILQKEIDYLKHRQEHNFFNYNVHYNWFYTSIIICTTVIFSFVAILASVMKIDKIYTSIFILFVFALWIMVFYFLESKLKKKVKVIENNFQWMHKKIRIKYKNMDIDIDAIDNPKIV